VVFGASTLRGVSLYRIDGPHRRRAAMRRLEDETPATSRRGTNGTASFMSAKHRSPTHMAHCVRRLLSTFVLLGVLNASTTSLSRLRASDVLWRHNV